MVEGDEGDRAALLAEVDRFCRRVVEPRVARPEAPIEPPELAAILEEAEALGLAGADASSGEDGSGLGAWESLSADGRSGTTLQLLARLGRANAAVAFAVHQRGLARVTSRLAGLEVVGGPIAIAPQGRLGLGRLSLARVLAGATLDDDDCAILADTYAADAPRILPLDPAMRGLLTLAFRDGALGWQLHLRPALVLTTDGHAHGLDELCTARVRPLSAPQAAAPAEPETLARVLAAHQLGLVAIALGAVEHAHALARAFAGQRRQGGATIDRHAAVQGLLATSRATIDAVHAQLQAHGDRPLGRARLGAAIACRARESVALSDAAHASLQTFGGLGYMRDAGLEKVSRDVNVLRVIAGAPPELALFLAEWERLHG
jgi:hypothetical protein